MSDLYEPMRKLLGQGNQSSAFPVRSSEPFPQEETGKTSRTRARDTEAEADVCPRWDPQFCQGEGF